MIEMSTGIVFAQIPHWAHLGLGNVQTCTGSDWGLYGRQWAQCVAYHGLKLGMSIWGPYGISMGSTGYGPLDLAMGKPWACSYVAHTVLKWATLAIQASLCP